MSSPRHQLFDAPSDLLTYPTPPSRPSALRFPAPLLSDRSDRVPCLALAGLLLRQGRECLGKFEVQVGRLGDDQEEREARSSRKRVGCHGADRAEPRTKSWAEGEGYRRAFECLQAQRDKLCRQETAESKLDQLLISTWGADGAAALWSSALPPGSVSATPTSVVQSPAYMTDDRPIIDTTGILCYMRATADADKDDLAG